MLAQVFVLGDERELLLGLFVAFFVLRCSTLLFLVGGALGDAEGVRLALTAKVFFFHLALPAGSGPGHLVFPIFNVFGIEVNTPFIKHFLPVSRGLPTF